MSVPSLSSEVPSVTDETFAAEVLGSAVPVLVEFWAQWCGPCHQLAPMLAEIAAERDGVLAVRKINADENPTTARASTVLAVPTMLLFVDGRPVWTVTGTRSKARLLAELDDAVAATRAS